MVKRQGSRVIDHNLIERTLMEIGREYRPGLIGWLKEDRGRWQRLLVLESRINEVALSKEDERVLKDTLDDYREFFGEMGVLFTKGDALPLFKRGERT
jgi:hypothetical protein